MNKFIKEIIKILEKETGIKIDPKVIEIPPDSKFGDYAFPCFLLAKKYKKSPVQIAEDLSKKLVFDKKIIAEVKSAGPYLNFFINKSELIKQTLTDVNEKKEDYGTGKKKKFTVMIESPGPNTNKPLHLGHVKNMVLGNSLAKIYEKLGNKVVKVDIVNDRGVHICKSMLAYKKWGKNKEPDKKTDHFVGDYYVLYAKNKEKHPEIEEEIYDMLKKWEKGDPETIKLWKKMNSWTIKGIHQTYKRYGVKIDKAYFESNHYTKGKSVIEKGLKLKIFEKDEKGSIIIDLEKEKLGKKTVLRSDGTSVYITQDLILATLRYQDYKMDKMIYIVGNEQIYHFKVLFKIFERFKFPYSKDCFHLPYGMVNLTEGKMKSREGNVVDADNLAEDVKNLAKNQIKKRHKSISESVLDRRSEVIAMSAIKFYILKYDPYNDNTFDPKKSISFEGETGPYIQYAYARISSILRKFKGKIGKDVNYDVYGKDEFLIAKNLSEYSSVVEKAADSYKPNYICRYLLDLCQLFNEYYHSNRILHDEKKIETARIFLIYCLKFVLSDGLRLLGIETLEEM